MIPDLVVEANPRPVAILGAKILKEAYRHCLAHHDDEYEEVLELGIQGWEALSVYFRASAIDLGIEALSHTAKTPVHSDSAEVASSPHDYHPQQPVHPPHQQQQQQQLLYRSASLVGSSSFIREQEWRLTEFPGRPNITISVLLLST